MTPCIFKLSCELEILIRGGNMLDKLDAALKFGTEALNLRAQRQE
ncbi:MAG: flagellar basal body rod protein FlgB, partial [Pantoea agglomerans]